MVLGVWVILLANSRHERRPWSIVWNEWSGKIIAAHHTQNHAHVENVLGHSRTGQRALANYYQALQKGLISQLTGHTPG